MIIDRDIFKRKLWVVPSAILMPALSPTMTQGHVVTWHKNVNDTVAVGDLLLDIETDKAVMEFESPQSGIIDFILVPGGTRDVPVGLAVAIVRSANEPQGAGSELAQHWAQRISSSPSNAAQEQHQPALANPSVASPNKERNEGPTNALPNTHHPSQPKPPVQAPVGQRNAHQPPQALDHSVTQKECAPSSMVKDLNCSTMASDLPHQGSAQRIISSPLARQWARHHGLSLHGITGTGPRGRIVKDDVIEAIKQRSQAAHDIATGKTVFASTAVPTHSGTTESPLTTDIPLSGMRRTIAQRLTLSKQTIPHFALSVSCDMDALLAMRQQLNQESKSISVNDLVIKACALALDQVQGMRLMWNNEQSATLVHSVDLAVAVSVEGGLITPIVRQAHLKTVRAIATEMKQLIGQAREGKLSPSQYQGGVFTLTNLGMMGIEEFTPIINPPHTGILAIGSTRPTPTVNAQGEIIVSQMMKATVVADHRTVDGSVAAEFLTRFQWLLAHPWNLLS